MARRSPGEGSVHRLSNPRSSNSRYRARKTVSLPNGEKQVIYRFGPTAKKALMRLNQAEQKVLSRSANAETATATQVLAELLTQKREVKQRKRKTIYNDADLWKRHIAPFIGDKPLSAVTFGDLQAIQYKLIQEEKYRTAELATILLKSLYSYALKRYRREILDGNVSLVNLADDLEKVERPPEAVYVPERLWTEDELHAFLGEAKRRYDQAIRNNLYPAFLAFVAAGLRRGEVLGMKQSALKQRRLEQAGQAFTQHYLEVVEQSVYYENTHHPDTPKTRAGIRKVPIDELAAAAFYEHIERVADIQRRNAAFEDHGLLFPSYNGRHLDPHNLYRSRDEIISKLSLPYSTLHQMRKVYTTYITKRLLQQGNYSPKIVMKLLGHNRPHVAQEVYTLLIDEDYQTATLNLPLKDLGVTPDDT